MDNEKMIDVRIRCLELVLQGAREKVLSASSEYSSYMSPQEVVEAAKKFEKYIAPREA